MRIQIKYKLKNEILPKDYRSSFMSLIKAALQEYKPLYKNIFYREQQMRPFTFSVHFPELKGYDKTKEVFNVGHRFSLNISS